MVEGPFHRFPVSFDCGLFVFVSSFKYVLRFRNLYDRTISTGRPVFVNQFPYESLLTVKDMFAGATHCVFANRSFDQFTMQCEPKWLAVSYSLENELPQFVSHYQNRAKLGLNNIWIIKPWNLARGLDMTVTDDLACIIRLRDSGPKLACKYIENPVLYQREGVGSVKFDMRFIVMLNSVKPLKVVMYNNFWLRFANKPFSLDRFDDYEKHFTVMNYTDPSKIKQVRCSHQLFHARKIRSDFMKQFIYRCFAKISFVNLATSIQN